MAVTILVIGCNAPVFKEYPDEVIKLAIETDSPILHSIELDDPPPLFIV
jgi:hypothetical protein